MQAGDRLAAILLHPLTTGARFQDWPLHITLVPWFRPANGTAELTVLLEAALGGIRPFEITVGKDAFFGYHGRKLVSLIQMDDSLALIERTIRRIIKDRGGWIADEKTRRKRTFYPHVTVQGMQRVHQEDHIFIDRFTMIEQEGSGKNVVGEVMLRG